MILRVTNVVQLSKYAIAPCKTSGLRPLSPHPPQRGANRLFLPRAGLLFIYYESPEAPSSRGLAPDADSLINTSLETIAVFKRKYQSQLHLCVIFLNALLCVKITDTNIYFTGGLCKRIHYKMFYRSFNRKRGAFKIYFCQVFGPGSILPSVKTLNQI